MRPIVSLFLLLSGIASLVYQVTWVRLLGLSMGSTSASISTVLAAFFLGMSLGSYSAEKITRNRINDLRVYIALELVIGVSGILLLPILLNLDALMAAFPILEASLTSKFVVAMLVLVVPTICMGATFPVVASILIRKGSDVGGGLSSLYSINTAGAVLGACMSGFVFIPLWGLDGSIYVAAALNFLIVAIAWFVNRRLQLPPVEIRDLVTATTKTHSDPTRFGPLALITLFITGFVSIASEVGWTKYLAIFTGTTIYGFAAILTIFLIGVAAGAWWIRSRLETLRSPYFVLAVGLAVLGLTLLLTRAGLGLVPNVYKAVNFIEAPAPVVFGVKYLLVFLLLIVPTFLLGAIFPLNLKLYCGDVHGVRARVGRAYAVNTVAAIMGAIVAGFWIIPEYGTDTLLSIGAFSIFAVAILFVPAVQTSALRIAVICVVALFASLHFYLPHLDYRAMIASVGYRYDFDVKAGRKPEFLYLKEGKAGVISVVTYDNKRAKVQSNGLNESVIDMHDQTYGLLVEQLLGLVPYLLHDNPKSAFVVGFGGGITTRALTYANLDSIKVVELEPAIIDAGRAIVKGEIPALLDPRVHLEINDARNTLLLDTTRYDILVAQPSHPWLAGVANLFTKEFFTIAQSRLNPGGIYGQWVNLFNMDATTLRAIFKTFFSVFPEGVAFGNLYTGDYLLFGSDHPLVLDYGRIEQRMKNSKIEKAFAHHNIQTPADLLTYVGLSRREILAATTESPMNTDTNILSEVRLARLIDVPEGDENPYRFLVKTFTFDVASILKPKEAAQQIFDAAMLFIKWDDPGAARHAVDQLASINPQLARALQYELLRSEEKLDQAVDLFNQHADWLDRTKREHVAMLVELGKLTEARAVVEKIADKHERSGMNAFMLYSEDRWKDLDNLNAQTPDEQKWRLLAIARHDARGVGPALEKLAGALENDIPFLRALVRYYATRPDDVSTDAAARKLAKRIDNEAARLTTVARSALDEKDVVRARRVIQKIVKLAPDWTQLDELRARVDEVAKAKETGNAG